MKDLRLLAVGTLLALAAACGSKEPTTAGPPPGAKRVDAATAGSLAGRVMLDGAAPANVPLKMSADPYCTSQNPNGATSENYIVTDGGLENVFVYVKDGLGNYYFEAPTDPVKLDQQGCRYRPHVLGIRTNQPLEISNSDDTMHNVHAMPEANREFNVGQAIKHQVARRTFTKQEVMVPFKCDVHGLDARVRRRDGSSVLRGHARWRQVRAQKSARGDLHGRGVAREARHRDAEGNDR